MLPSGLGLPFGSNEWIMVVKGKWVEDTEEETVECVDPLNGCVNPSNRSYAAQVILNVWDNVDGTHVRDGTNECEVDGRSLVLHFPLPAGDDL
jgi:hypothetical protein